jgi:cytochrome b561
VPARSTDVAVFFFGLSALTMLVPLTGYLLTQPRARATFRFLLERLHGG